MTNKKTISENPIRDPKQLTDIYKRNGSFDKQRKILLENFKKSETHQNLLLKLKLIVESKVKNEPSILMKNKGKMAALIQGGIINEHVHLKSEKNANSLLSIVDKDIEEKIIDSSDFHDYLRSELKDIKRQLMGISDEEYIKVLEHEKEEENRKLEAEKKREKEKELAYKNNFKLKNLNIASKMPKAPRINLNPSLHHSDNLHFDTDKRKGGQEYSRPTEQSEKHNSKPKQHLQY